MSHFQLIAFDMDGTLLTSAKNISPLTRLAISEASKSGKTVVLSTGRCLAELREALEELPEVRYLVCVSGALVYDTYRNEIIYRNAISPETVDRIIDVAKREDTFLQFLTLESTLEKRVIPNMEHYQIAVYRPMFKKVATLVDNIEDYYQNHREGIEKVNIYHVDSIVRENSRKRLQGAPLVLANSEVTSLECTAPGTTKGAGLEKLCAYLGIPVSDTIAVGDADNDLAIMHTAGLSVAMGNARHDIKDVCDVTVADNDHDGCAEAIYKYLLADETVISQ